jgi:ABC-type transport system substrate-binding protein
VAEVVGIPVWCQDEAGPYQAIPQPGQAWQLKGKPVCQPHEYVRGGTAKLLTLFRPATGEVRAKGVPRAPNTVLHPCLQHELGDADVSVVSAASRFGRALFMRVGTGPTADVNVRKAIAHAIPYDDLVSAAYAGHSRKAESLFYPDVLGYLPNPELTYDLDKAKESLAQSNQPNGFDIDCFFDASYPEDEQAALFMRQEFAKIGIKMNAVKLPSAQFLGRGYARELPMAINLAGTWVQEPTYIIDLFMMPDSISNWSHYNNPEIIKLRQGFRHIRRIYEKAKL